MHANADGVNGETATFQELRKAQRGEPLGARSREDLEDPIHL